MESNSTETNSVTTVGIDAVTNIAESPVSVDDLISNFTTTIKERPEWLFIDDHDKEKVDIPALAKEIMKESRMITYPNFPYPLQYNVKGGYWQNFDIDKYTAKIATEKLQRVGKWTTKAVKDTSYNVSINCYQAGNHMTPAEVIKTDKVAFNNGVYNFDTGKLEAHDPDLMLLHGHDYNLKMHGEAVKTKQWLADLTGQSLTYIMELIGSCFYHGMPFQELTILSGEGSNGKSTLLNHITSMLGMSNISSVALEQFADKNNRFATSSVYLKEANIFADIDSKYLDKISVIKALTGDDTILIEFKNKNPFSYKSFAKLIFSANELPSFKANTHGDTRRFKIVPLETKITKEFISKHDLKAIEQEIPIFAYECLEMFRKCLERGHTSESERMAEVKEQWLERNNPVERFLTDECIRDARKVGRSVTYVYSRYRTYCANEGIKCMSKQKMTTELEKAGYDRLRTVRNGKRAWRFINLDMQDTDKYD
ncbi:phage/plasmid primase, P4 family [Brochothrix thermosphacta]|uniref:phage/plasmid primase, P4 family n=1 Tax=Brochothrix thermosphacta TaxID=2756 RepID=UPI0039B06392